MGLGREDSEAELEAGRQTSAGSESKGQRSPSELACFNRSQAISGIHALMATP